ncbi:MAG: Rrf2 family transcriptional regulator, iron-sulfur cluster assembly transcription factor [Bacteroidales bacterium]|nr:Rrf2 family transcriptional regulator, iron-sulfur cluster assembly transcription factor [Bacteroidales bacterium]MDN5330425.1 Rrf2 family transcriptional regulator, iron-sulfur cluster assembly transcription factor [Bacteroidales bacterium]
MRFNTKVRYGLRVMIDIALNQGKGQGVFQKDISFRQDISFKYLDSIINSLKVAGLIKKAGPRKGYILSRSINEISLMDIEKAFNTPVEIQECLSNPDICKMHGICKARKVWSSLNDRIMRFLNDVKLSDILEENLPE